MELPVSPNNLVQYLIDKDRNLVMHGNVTLTQRIGDSEKAQIQTDFANAANKVVELNVYGIVVHFQISESV